MWEVLDINFTEVNIKAETYYSAAIALHAEGSSFIGDSVSGTILVENKTDEDQSVLVGGFAGYSSNCNFSDCVSDIDITVNTVGDIEVFGFAKITKSFKDETKNAVRCYNKGDIKVTSNNPSKEAFVSVCGFSDGAVDSAAMKSCGNSGNIVVKCNGVAYGAVGVFGLSSNVKSISKGYNTGDISLSGKINTTNVSVCGLGEGATTIKESYNTGEITVSSSVKSIYQVTGISSYVKSVISNCYNTGKIKVNGKLSAESVAAGIAIQTEKITNSYNVGTISGNAKKVGKYSFSEYLWKDMKGNYYIKGKPHNGETFRNPAGTSTSKYLKALNFLQNTGPTPRQREE